MFARTAIFFGLEALPATVMVWKQPLSPTQQRLGPPLAFFLEAERKTKFVTNCSSPSPWPAGVLFVHRYGPGPEHGSVRARGHRPKPDLRCRGGVPCTMRCGIPWHKSRRGVGHVGLWVVWGGYGFQVRASVFGRFAEVGAEPGWRMARRAIALGSDRGWVVRSSWRRKDGAARPSANSRRARRALERR